MHGVFAQYTSNIPEVCIIKSNQVKLFVNQQCFANLAYDWLTERLFWVFHTK